MNAHVFGAISGVLVFASAIPYFYNAIRGRIELHALSWSLWTLIGISMLVTYIGSGARDSFWPVVANVVNPALILAIILWRKKRAGETFTARKATEALAALGSLEWACLILGIGSLVIYAALFQFPHLVPISLYVSLLADVCAAIPTIKMVWKNPNDDKPFAWSIFTIGYACAIPAITEPSVASYALPVYMVITYGTIAVITSVYRLKTKAPLLEWI